MGERKLTHLMREALEWAGKPGGGWPHAKANRKHWTLRSYEALEKRGLVKRVGECDANDPEEHRIQFVATDAGRAALEASNG